MPTRKERDTVAKLMLVIANAFDPHRVHLEVPYVDGQPRPEYRLGELQKLADEAMTEAQQMLASWGG